MAEILGLTDESNNFKKSTDFENQDEVYSNGNITFDRQTGQELDDRGYLEETDYDNTK